MSVDAEYGQRAIDLTVGILRMCGTHDAGNAAIQRLIQDLLVMLPERPGRAGQPLVIHIDADDVFVDQELLRLDHPSWTRAQQLGTSLSTQDSNQIRILPTATRDDLTGFFELFARAARSSRVEPRLGDVLVFRASVSRQEIVQTQGRTEAPTGVRVEDYERLMVLGGEYIARAKHVRFPHTVTVRRALQQFAEAVIMSPERWTALFLRPDQSRSLGRHAARSVGLAVMLAARLGLPRARISSAGVLAFQALGAWGALGSTWCAAGDEARRQAMADWMRPARPGDEDADAQVQFLATAAALGEASWPAGLPVPFDAALAALAIRADALRQGLGAGSEPCSPGAAMARAAQAMGRCVLVPEALVAGAVALLGEVPPGTVVRLGEAAGRYAVVVGERVMATEQGTVTLGPLVPVHVVNATGGPWPAWIAASLASD